MKQVSNDTAVLRLARMLKAHYDSNPDVGMGPSYGYFVEQAGKQLDLEPSDYNGRQIEDTLRRQG